MTRIIAALPYRIDVYTKQTNKNDSGQQIATWKYDRTIRCDYMSSRGEERLVQRMQNPVSYIIWTNDIDVINQNELRNLRDRQQNVIDAGPFNVIGIRRHRNWKSVGHLALNLQKVLP